MNRTKILSITAVIAIIVLLFVCSDLSLIASPTRENFFNRRRRWKKPRCSGSGCTFYDKFGYYRNHGDYFEHNKYRLEYPSYPMYYYEYPNDYFLRSFYHHPRYGQHGHRGYPRHDYFHRRY